MRRLAPWILAVASAACAHKSAFNRHYDMRSVRRVGVVAFEAPDGVLLGAEDLFAKHLLHHGYNVVERRTIAALLDEQRLGLSGLYSPKTAKRVGRILGVDALLLGSVSEFSPGRREVVMARSHYTYHHPVVSYRSRPGPDGSLVTVAEQVGANVMQESRDYAQVVSLEAKVGLVVRLVDVETGEILWVGSARREAGDAVGAAESAAAHLVRELRRHWSPQLALK